MADLIFSVRNIFNDHSSDGCLFQYEANSFHIPSYQRGYKWGSTHVNDPVPILLKDLIDAFSKSPNKKYYLQYITISKNGNRLEVIDGQQRLTTLSIMLPIFNLLLDEVINISQSKLDYAIREEIFSQHINIPKGLQQFVSSTWDKSEGLSLNGALFNNQDVFYLHGAASKIHIILNGARSEKGNEYLSSFYEFILDQVMIIVNAVESHIPGEKVFKNLNSNKVPLTEVDLIKGLLLTRIARNNGGNKKHFREIIEIRSSLGRKWDEMAAMANEPAFSAFFFRELNGFEGMLLLVAKINGFKEAEVNADGHFPLFNFFNGQIEDVEAIFQELILCFSVLKDWYATPQIYNLLGFVFFTKSKGFKKRDFIQANLKVSKRDLLNALNSIKSTRLHSQPDKLKYGEEDDEIFNILLALSVFPKIEYQEKELREHKFDFYNFNKLQWTLEHIFPQSPEGKGAVLNQEQKIIILNMLGGRENIEPEIVSLLEKEIRDDIEKEKYYNLLKSNGPLNEIGNMALLSDSVNASIGCGFFNDKREQILLHMQKGKFVPLHTFNVFSKTILGKDPGNLLAWSKEDISVHTKFIASRIFEIKKEQI